MFENDMKYLGTNLTKDLQDLYVENYKMLTEEIKNSLNKYRNILRSYIGRSNIVNKSIFPKLIYIALIKFLLKSQPDFL